MGGNPDAEDGNVDEGDEYSSADLQPVNKSLVVVDDCDSVDDDLHEQLDFKRPEEEAEEQHRNSSRALVENRYPYASGAHTLVSSGQ